MRHRILPILRIPTRTLPINDRRHRRIITDQDILRSEIAVCVADFIFALMDLHDIFAENLLRFLEIPVAAYELVESRDVVERAEALDGAHADLAACIAVG